MKNLKVEVIDQDPALPSIILVEEVLLDLQKDIEAPQFIVNLKVVILMMTRVLRAHPQTMKRMDLMVKSIIIEIDLKEQVVVGDMIKESHQ